jgi:hypothetical protein
MNADFGLKADGRALEIFSGSNRFRLRLIGSKKIRNLRIVPANAYRQGLNDPRQPIKSFVNRHRF